MDESLRLEIEYDRAPTPAAIAQVRAGLMAYNESAVGVADCAGVELRLQKVVQLTPQPFTTLGWQVANVTEIGRKLARRGVTLERYAHLPQDAAGIWQAPSGARVAWFKDPDGNLMSIAQYPAG